MNLMTNHILQPQAPNAFAKLLRDELSENARAVLGRADWSNDEILRCQDAIDNTIAKIHVSPNATKDSVKGEEAMGNVYGYGNKASDIITLHGSGVLKLSECKCAIKIGGMGPFRSPQAFCRSVSDKFYHMGIKLLSDGESISPVRVIIVNDQQFDFSVAHIQALMQDNYPQGSFSCDGTQYDYVLCSASTAEHLVCDLNWSGEQDDRHWFFSL